MKFDHDDNGNCRIYYKNGRDLYCWQQEFKQSFTFYFCSKDGEPQYPVAPLAKYDPPFQDTPIGQQLYFFLKEKGMLND